MSWARPIYTREFVAKAWRVCIAAEVVCKNGAAGEPRAVDAGHCPYSSLRMSCEYPAEKISVERRRRVGLATDTARRRSACREVAGLALADTARRQQLVHCQSPISSRINDYKCCGYRFIAALIHNGARITITSSVSINFLNRRAESTLGIRTKLSRWVETEALVLVRERDRS